MSPPSSLPPKGVPQSGGNAKYAIVAVVLLLGAGGLFLLRGSSKPDLPPPPPPAPSTSASAAATTNPLLDDIPPPPPADTTPEAGKPNVVYVNGGGGGNGGCDGKCSQSYASPELGQALQMRANQSRRCYSSALSQDPSLKGHVSISVRVGTSGNVCSASVAGNDMASPGVANCAANVFRNGSYPAPHGGCVDAVVPLNFVPMGGQ
jgi:hypothetical protein